MLVHFDAIFPQAGHLFLAEDLILEGDLAFAVDNPKPWEIVL